MAAHPCSSSSSLLSSDSSLLSSDIFGTCTQSKIISPSFAQSSVCVCVELCVSCCIALERDILVFWKGCLPVHLKRGPPATRGIDEVPTLLHPLCHASPVHAINCNPFQRSSPSQGKWWGNDIVKTGCDFQIKLGSTRTTIHNYVEQDNSKLGSTQQ